MLHGILRSGAFGQHLALSGKGHNQRSLHDREVSRRRGPNLWSGGACPCGHNRHCAPCRVKSSRLSEPSSRLDLTMTGMCGDALREAALDYHRLPTPGKISDTPTKGLKNQRDLSLAYSPGVAYACLAIRDNPLEAARITSRANLVAVVSNGTAVLGLGNIGALAGKPVMEGKGCL